MVLSGRSWRALYCAHPVCHPPDLLDFAYDLIAVGEPLTRVHGVADTGWRAGGDDVARLDGQSLRERLDQLGNLENHRSGRGVLPRLSVHRKGDLQRVRI